MIDGQTPLRRSILVTDGEQRAALATARSLGHAGHIVSVCASRPGSLTGASKYATREFVVPSALDSPDAYADAVAAAAAEANADLVLPVSEPSVLALLPVRDSMRATIPMPSIECFRAICDKSAVLAAAERRGLAVPRQVTLDSAADGAAHDWSGRFPLVIKPIRSVVQAGGQAADRESGSRSKTSVVYAPNRAALDEQLVALDPSAYPVMVQERIAGPGFAISVLIWDGELKAAFAHSRVREKPPSGGVSVLRESIPLDSELLQRSVELLGDFNWQGVAMVEYKLQQSTGVPYVMEINGRLWGSLQLAIDSGVDFPSLLVDCALTKPQTPVLSYSVGTRTWWEWGDVDHLLARLRKSRNALSLPPGTPGRLRALMDFLSAFRSGIHSEVMRLDDPLPFVRESWDWIRRR